MQPVVPTPACVPQPSNGLGVAGFIVSLVGLLTCGFFAPIGLLLSLIGLVKAPRGFAIAGTVLGALGSLWFLVAGFALIAGCMGIGVSTTAAMKIGDYYERHGTLPDAAEGQALVDPQGAGRYRYVPVDAERFEIHTPGDDHRFDTADDVSRTFNAREISKSAARGRTAGS